MAPRGDKNISCSLLIIFQSKLRVCLIEKMMNPEYDFADEHEATNEKQADDQFTGDHEDSDEEDVKGPPPPTEFKRLLEEWARDFEKLEAVAYHKATASEDISKVEAQRLQKAVEAATSSGLIQKFMSQSGDPAISDTFREIHQMEAATLLSARNDATRRAAKAKEAAELVASKQGLAKDPAAVTAANKLFAACEDMRTRIQTRVAKFIQNPLLDHQKTANSWREPQQTPA
jgi:hypothetical protein